MRMMRKGKRSLRTEMRRDVSWGGSRRRRGKSGGGAANSDEEETLESRRNIRDGYRHIPATHQKQTSPFWFLFCPLFWPPITEHHNGRHGADGYSWNSFSSVLALSRLRTTANDCEERQLASLSLIHTPAHHVYSSIKTTRRPRICI